MDNSGLRRRADRSPYRFPVQLACPTGRQIVVNAEDTIWPRLLALVEEFPTMGVSRLMGSRELTRATNLVSDLGLAGDDAFEFMEKFAEMFEVKRGDYDSSNYFEPESLWFLPRLTKHKPKMKITLGMLEFAAREGEWSSASLDLLPPERAGS